MSNFSVIASAGSCGDNVTWVMSGLSTLIIDGSGDMDDFVSYYDQPWYEYASRITSVIIRDGVTSIGKCAFRDLINLTDVSLADSVTEIGRDAFWNCESLSYIKLPENLTKINSYAFYSCEQLDDVIIPERVTTIGEYAFDSCCELSGINIPKNVVSIGECAFRNCEALQAINVDVENKYFESDAQGVLFSKGKVDLIQYPLGSPTTDYDIPSGVKVLKNASFFSSKNLENITIPESVNTIEKEAFARSVALVSVTIPKSVQKMGDNIFYSCEALESAIIYAEITELPISTFLESGKLKMVVLPPSMKVIKNNAFLSCGSLTGIVIPKSVETIEDDAFGRCLSLENVYYLGTAEQWSAVTITEPEITGYGNKYLVDATIHYCRETEKVDSNCTSIGKQSGIYCDECQEFVFGGEEIPISPDKHNYQNGKCSYCGLRDLPVKNAEGYYEIGDLGSFISFAEQFNSGDLGSTVNAILTADIDLEGFSWIPIGKASAKYKGVFDGQGHTISNFNMTITGAGNWGLFGYATGEGTVIKNFSISGDVTTALTSNVDVQYGVVGQADGGAEIRNVHSSVNLTSGDSYQKKYFGGIVGRTGNITVDSCSFRGKLSLGSNTLDCVGGIVGYVYNGKTAKITNCGFYGDIDTTYSGGNVGGILGYYNGENAKALTVSNCLSVGTLPEGRNAIVGTIKNYGSTNAGSNNYYLDGVTNSVTNVTAAVTTQKQLASGEIAIVLGDAWGQMSNTEGSLPIITDNELYKVVTVGETGNYSVANVGDTNGDGTVDINDYQAMVNTVTSGGHAQSETESYDDIIKYDLNGDGYLDVIDAYLLHLFINGFTTVDVYAVGDYDLNGKAFEEADIKAIKHAIENSEKLATYKKYASDINGDGKLDENDLTALAAKYGEVTGAECADNVEVYYRWGNKYSTCTATAMCTLCDEKVAVETVNTTSETLAELTCTQDGKVKYTAIFENELFEEKIKTVTTDMLPHNLSDGVCTVCGIIDATNMTADELETAVAELLLVGKTNITVALAEDAEQEMFSAIRTAFSESTAADGSINLTISGAKTVPDYGFFDIDDYYDNDDKNIAGDKLKSLTLTDVETIGDFAFSACTYLESVNLPQVVTIGECAFNEWKKGTKLTSLDLPNATTIGDWAFAYSSLLTSVNLPKVTSIGVLAFGYCDLRTLDLPEATTIGGEAFMNNYNLVSCSAPKAITIDYYPWGSNGTSKLERLELTATGDFTLYNNLFAYTPIEQIDLVLNKDKESQVTQNEDGTATWAITSQYGGSLTYIFKSITFVGE